MIVTHHMSYKKSQTHDGYGDVQKLYLLRQVVLSLWTAFGLYLMLFKETFSLWLLSCHEHTSVFRFQTDKNVHCDELNVLQESDTISYQVSLEQSNPLSNYVPHCGLRVPKCLAVCGACGKDTFIDSHIQMQLTLVEPNPCAIYYILGPRI